MKIQGANEEDEKTKEVQKNMQKNSFCHARVKTNDDNNLFQKEL